MTSSQAAVPWDEMDTVLLAEIRELFARLDPSPAGLVDEVGFALTVQAMHAEVAELVGLQPAGVRTAEVPDQASTMTFSAPESSVTVTVSAAGAGRARLDGYLTGAADQVELTLEGAGTFTAVVEDDRFVFHDVPRGSAHLLVQRPGSRPLLTPVFEV